MLVMPDRLRGAAIGAHLPAVIPATLTFDGFRAAGPGLKVSPVRRSSLQDAALAALLLAGTWALGGADSPTGWILIVVCAAAVAVRRRWPIAALAAASLAALA